MFVIKEDIFLITLILDVSKWYDIWYTGNSYAMKSLHLQTVQAYYDPIRFEECNNLHDERIKFLVEIQKIIDDYVELGGYGEWMI